MHNMSSRFYNYLSEKIISYFKNNNPLSGDKFYVQFETEEQVVTLYKELKNNTIVEKFVYHDDKRAQTYESYQLKFGECFLIVAAAIEGGVHPDFLAQLRNMVGRDAGYENKAILFIHCSSLDSILGGAGSLSKEGMPLNIGLLKKDINRKIQETGFGRVDKHILLQYLKNKSNELEGTNESIFDYEDIIEVLGDSQITSSEYRTFELFPDENLEGLNEKKLIARLNDNHSHYVRISEIHNYGLDETRLEKYYGEDGAKRLAKDDWKDLTYLTEGRKFGWSAWFATQSLKILKDDEVVRLLQASFKLYFKPTDDEMTKISKQIDVTGDGNWLSVIQGLQKGQCIVVGDRMLANGKVGAVSPTVTNVLSFENRQSEC